MKTRHGSIIFSSLPQLKKREKKKMRKFASHRISVFWKRVKISIPLQKSHLYLINSNSPFVLFYSMCLLHKKILTRMSLLTKGPSNRKAHTHTQRRNTKMRAFRYLFQFGSPGVYIYLYIKKFSAGSYKSGSMTTHPALLLAYMCKAPILSFSSIYFCQKLIYLDLFLTSLNYFTIFFLSYVFILSSYLCWRREYIG